MLSLPRYDEFGRKKSKKKKAAAKAGAAAGPTVGGRLDFISAGGRISVKDPFLALSLNISE